MKYPLTATLACVLTLLLATQPAGASPAKIEAATARQADGKWTFKVTLSHPDTGWEHYADGWRIEAPDGTVLGIRELLHPHVNEQPFTRSLSGVTIPGGLDQVVIRARDNLDGWGDATFPLDLPD